MSTLFGINNLVKTAVLSGATADPALPVENIANDHGAASLGWQTPAGVTLSNLFVTFATAGSPFRIISFHNTNWTSVATISISGYSSTATLFDEMLPGPSPGYKQVVLVLPATVIGDYVLVTIDDPTNPDGHLNTPQMFVGDAWETAYSFGPESSYGHDPLGFANKTRGGQTFPTNLANPRVFNFSFEALVSDEAWLYLGEIQRKAPLGGNFLYVPDGDSLEINREAVFGMIGQINAVKWRQGLVDIRQWSGTITERL